MKDAICAAVACVSLLAGASASADMGDQLAKLTADDGAAKDYFGYSTGISGDTVIVGAYGDDDGGSESGSAYLFDIATGSQLAKLTADDPGTHAAFGLSVAISGNTAIVGAPGDYLSRTHPGSAYLFNAATGSHLLTLTANDAGANDRFGISVAVSGSTAIVGAQWDDDNGSNSGSAYLFDILTGNQLAKLIASDAAGGAYFGYSVAISGDTAIVGAYQGDGDGAVDSGSAYLFDITTGDQLAKLTADDAADGDNFGMSVGISGNTAIVGARGDDDSGSSSGSAYLFDITTGNQVAKLTADDAATEDQFGRSVAISGNIAIVGAHWDDDGGYNSGSAYLFNVITGNQLAKLTAGDPAAQDQFGGDSLAISGNTAIVGARDIADGGLYSGAVYLFDVPEPTTLGMLALGSLGLVRRRNRRACM